MSSASVHILWFDPGGVTGWAWLCLDRRTFTRPEHTWQDFMLWWDIGELEGTDNAQGWAADKLMADAKQLSGGIESQLVIGTEDFDLTAQHGDKHSLLAPVRVNAVLDWLAANQGHDLLYQNRALRISNTPERLRTFGFEGKWTTTGRGKDATAAMQHAVYRMRDMKQKSLTRPWRIDGRWDCACTRRKPCDIRHPH